MLQTRLTRSEENRILTGVCGGLAEYLDVDPVLVRLGFVILGFASGIGVLIYLVLAVITPKASNVASDYVYDEIEGLKSAESTRRANRGFVAGLLIVLGVYFLLASIGVDLAVLAPIMLIGLGVWLLRRRNG